MVMRRRTLAPAILIGVFATAAFTGLAFVAGAAHHAALARALFWQNTALQALVPDNPIHEGTPLNVVAFVASFPLAALVYTLIALRWLRRAD